MKPGETQARRAKMKSRICRLQSSLSTAKVERRELTLIKIRVSIMSKKIGSQKGLSQGEMAVVSNDFNMAGSDTSASALSVRHRLPLVI